MGPKCCSGATRAQSSGREKARERTPNLQNFPGEESDGHKGWWLGVPGGDKLHGFALRHPGLGPGSTAPHSDVASAAVPTLPGGLEGPVCTAHPRLLRRCPRRGGPRNKSGVTDEEEWAVLASTLKSPPGRGGGPPLKAVVEGVAFLELYRWWRVPLHQPAAGPPPPPGED